MYTENIGIDNYVATFLLFRCIRIKSLLGKQIPNKYFTMFPLVRDHTPFMLDSKKWNIKIQIQQQY